MSFLSPRSLLLATLAAWVLTPSVADAGAMWTWGARISSPQLFSASGGVLIGRIDAPPRPPDAPPRDKMYIPSGLFLQAEPGIGGGKVGLGFAKGLPPVGAAGIKAFVLRTWGQPLWGTKNRTYAGLEVDFTLFMKLSLGVMRRVDRAPHDTRLTGGIGIGF
jgi:hypothetical protein